MRDNEYTSQQPGFKLVFVALVVAAIMGLSFRLYFSAQRMKSLIEQELARRPSPVAIQFKTAEFSLARGMIPQIAIRLVEVEGRSVKSCAKVPGFKISELFIPFRPLALIRGKISIGVIHSEKLEIDLDAMKDRCNESEVAEQLPSEPARPVQNRAYQSNRRKRKGNCAKAGAHVQESI